MFPSPSPSPVQTNTPHSKTRFETYFPHVDNIYSHRSTQRHKRRPIVSHYWDCRLRGRVPGTPKSTDPNKKKRKRQGRGLDLCDVTIKIVEYVAPSTSDTPAEGLPEEVREVLGEGLGGLRGKVWTVQRVCAFGTEKSGVGAPPASHKHTLERSDEVKKSSVTRWLTAREKEAKKAAARVRPVGYTATGLAAATVRKRSVEADVKLYASCLWYVAIRRQWRVSLLMDPVPFLSASGSRSKRRGWRTSITRPVRRSYQRRHIWTRIQGARYRSLGMATGLVAGAV